MDIVRLGSVLWAAAICLVSPAGGQVEAVDPYLAAVTSDGAALRSGDLDSYYVVEELRAGTVLLVDGKQDGWLRVGYPAGATVFIFDDQGRVSPDGKTVTPSAGAALKAPNAKFGLKGSWRNVAMASEGGLPPSLPVLGIETSSDGSRTAYRVPAPAGARAFIRAGAVREATASEIDAYLRSGGVAPNRSRTEHPPAQPTTPRPPTAHPPEAGAPATPVVAPTPEVQQPAEPLVAPDPQPDDVSLLLRAFEGVQSQAITSAEVDPLIGEFEAAIAKLGDDGVDALARTALQQRLAVLRILKRLQAQQRALEEAKRQADADAKSVSSQVSNLAAGRAYTVVGRLTTSAVYDGKSRPLMFRVEAVGTSSARTLGYLKPDERFGLEKMLGQIVGVVGRSAMGESDGRLNIIAPERVDNLTPGN